MNKHRALIILFLITLFGAFLRLNRFLDSPPALFIDEADIGYQAYSILKTGKDYFGNFLPTHIQSFADNRTPLYIYFTVPSVALFGLTSLAVRLPAVIFGILSIPLIYWFVRNLNLTSSNQEQEIHGILAAFILAVLPWHIHYSRMGFEVTLLLFSLTLGLGFFIKWINIPKVIYLNLGLVFLLSTTYVYSTAKLFIPLLLICLLFIQRKQIIKLAASKLILTALLGLVISFPMVNDLIFGAGRERFSILSVFSDKNSFAPYMHYQWITGYAAQFFPFNLIHPTTIANLFFNKPVNFVFLILNSYFSVFSPQFLMISGDPNIRHSLISSGVAGFSITILFVLGFFRLIVSAKTFKKIFLLLLLFLAPIPSAITVDGGYHATRLFLVVLPLTIIAAYGLFTLVQKPLSKRLLLLYIPFIILFGWEISRDQFLRLMVYPQASYEYWNWGWKEAMGKLEDLSGQYRYVFISRFDGGPNQTLYAFHTQLDPLSFQKYSKNPDTYLADLDLKVRRYSDDNIYFSDVESQYLNKPLPFKVLALVAPDKVTKENLPNVEIVDQVNDPFGRPAFYLVRNRPVSK